VFVVAFSSLVCFYVDAYETNMLKFKEMIFHLEPYEL